MRSASTSKGPTGVIGLLLRLVQTVLPGFLVSVVVVFLTTELAKLGSVASGRLEQKPAQPPAAESVQPLPRPHRRLSTGIALLIGLVPTALLGITLFYFLDSGGGEMLAFNQPSSGSVLFNKAVLTPGEIELLITNPGPQPIEIVRLAINDTILPYRITPAASIPQFGNALIQVAYPWVRGEAYTINLFTSDSVAYTTTIDAAQTSALPTLQTLVKLTLMGAGAGLIPLLAGIAWAPAFSAARKRKFLFPMALTLGLLAYSGFIVTGEALNKVQLMNGAYQGIGLVAIGVMGTFLILDTFSRWQAAVGQPDREQRLNGAWLLAIATGLRSFAEGLVIGACFAGGAALLGTLLLVSFLVQNFTEGLRWMAGLQADQPSFWRLLALAIIGGIPAIFGIWTGAFVDSQPWTTLFFAVGGGAFLEGAFEFYRSIQRSTARQPRPFTVFIGAILGMLALYAAGLLL